MKILVPVKRVVDYTVKVHVKPDQSDVETSNVKMSMNPFDEIAVEEALKIKESGGATEIIIVSIGTEASTETIRHGLALGADRGILVQTGLTSPEPLTVAKALAKIVEKESPQLVLMGKQAIDDDCNQTGQMLAALLDWPQGTFSSKTELIEGQINVTREVDGGLETNALKLPAIITTDLRLNVPRYATLPNIMRSKQKPLETIAMDDLGVDPRQRLQLIKVIEPPKRTGGAKVESVTELIQKLEEAKVI